MTKQCKSKLAYFYVDSDGDIMCEEWEQCKEDIWRYITTNFFMTQEEAEEYKKQIEYTARYKNYIEEHSDPIDWNNEEQLKYHTIYHTNTLKILVDYNWSCKTQGVIYASSKQIIEDAIKEIGEDNFKKYVLGVK